MVMITACFMLEEKYLLLYRSHIVIINSERQ